LTPLRWLQAKARQSLRRLRSPGSQKTEARNKDLYCSLGDRALESLQPGERMPELILHDIERNHQQLSRCWDKQPALLVTMSLSCGQTRRHAPALRRLARRFEQHINTVIVYIVEVHPADALSPYGDRIWVPVRNEIAGIHCVQPKKR